MNSEKSEEIRAMIQQVNAALEQLRSVGVPDDDDLVIALKNQAGVLMRLETAKPGAL